MPTLAEGAAMSEQRCDGSGEIRAQSFSGHIMFPLFCPGCPACKPKATPVANPLADARKQAESKLSILIAAAEREPKATPTSRENRWAQTDDGSPASVSCKDDSGSTAEHQASELGASRADSAAPVVHVVKLHDDTLRALDDLINSGTLAGVSRKLAAIRTDLSRIERKQP